jgi:hypothetical protein
MFANTISDKEASLFEAMLSNNGATQHARNACKAYNFDFFNDSTTTSDDVEPVSPFSWTEEENNVEYFKPTVRLELKPRMTFSAPITKEEKSDGAKVRLSLPALGRVSIFSQSTTASTNLDASFVSLASASSIAKTSCFESIFSSSEIKRDEDFNISVKPAHSRTGKLNKFALPVHEEECEQSDDEEFNNRDSSLDDLEAEFNNKKTAIVNKQASEFSSGSEKSSGRKHKLHSRRELEAKAE